MALSHELPIYKDTYKLILLVFEYTKEFAREYKYTLGQDMKRDSIQLVRSIYRANRNSDKRQYLEEFLDNFEILKLEVPSFGASFITCAYNKRTFLTNK